MEYTAIELKKLFYKTGQTAYFVRLKKGVAYYVANVKLEGTVPSAWGNENYQTVHFNIPIAEIGDGEFKDDMPAKLLIRWMLTEKEN